MRFAEPPDFPNWRGLLTITSCLRTLVEHLGRADRLRLIKPPKDAAQWSTKGMKIGSKVDQVRDAKNIKLRAQRNNNIPPPPPNKK